MEKEGQMKVMARVLFYIKGKLNSLSQMLG